MITTRIDMKKRKDQKDTTAQARLRRAFGTLGVLYISINARSLSTLLKNKKFIK
jgi:hypothetical protein